MCLLCILRSFVGLHLSKSVISVNKSVIDKFKTSLLNVLWFLSYSQKQNFRTNSPFLFT
ncbi:hypothetical protein TVAGG3_0876700, partial [Trichomonas vaginalis G3]|uniref:hypothetical protein n=1 Tax=Trichomonas vaginalis (strain ATCC PRA-98 / G3) TaxID=412133 RepID=UPI0021E59D11